MFGLCPSGSSSIEILHANRPRSSIMFPSLQQFERSVASIVRGWIDR